MGMGATLMRTSGAWGAAVTRMATLSIFLLLQTGCELASVAMIGADYMGLDPKTQADKAAAREMINSCQNNPRGYAKKDGVTTTTPCSQVLAAYHQAVLQHCHKRPSGNVEIYGVTRPCSKVFEEERQAVALQCSKNHKGYATVHGVIQPCPAP